MHPAVLGEVTLNHIYQLCLPFQFAVEESLTELLSGKKLDLKTVQPEKAFTSASFYIVCDLRLCKIHISRKIYVRMQNSIFLGCEGVSNLKFCL